MLSTAPLFSSYSALRLPVSKPESKPVLNTFETLFGTKRTEAQQFATGQMHAANYVRFFPNFKPPAVKTAFHADRRQAFLKALPPNTTVVLVGNHEQTRNSDVNYKFRQDSNFYYLTGFDEPNSVAILSNEAGKDPFTLVVPPRSKKDETWDGKREGKAGAVANYGADKAYSNKVLTEVLRGTIANSKNLRWISADNNPAYNHRFKTLVGIHQPGAKVQEARDVINGLRVVKTPYEQALIQRAVDISIKGHRAAMENLKLTKDLQRNVKELNAGLNEGIIQAEIERPFRQHGAVRVGYETIAGAGSNSCILHYNTNKEDSHPGDLVLVDAGAEYGYYTADITRTWPINGKFTAPQKEIYDVVLDAQESGIQMVKPGVTLAGIHQNSILKVTQGLMRLGVIKGDATNPADVATSIKKLDYRDYFMHGTSHMMGLDVHDMQHPTPDGSRRFQADPLEPGMVFTVEPGIYISPEVGRANDVPRKYWGIGVRIEDDVMVTGTGVKNMSEALPRETHEIEAMMAGRSNLTKTLNLNA